MAFGEPTTQQQHDAFIASMYRQFIAWSARWCEYAKRMGDADRDDAYLEGLGYDNTIQDPEGFNLTEVQKFRSAVSGLKKVCDVAQGEATQPAADDLTYWARHFTNGMTGSVSLPPSSF